MTAQGFGIFMALLGLGLVRPTWADAEKGSQPSSLHYLTYEEAVEIALRDNVDLLALRDQEEAQKLRSSQALAPNEPVYSYTNNDVPGFSITQTPAQAIYQLNWTLGFPGKALSNSASMSHQAKAIADQAITQEISIMTSLSNTYVALSTNEALYKVFMEEQKRDKELKRLLEKKYAASQAAKVDLLNAEVVTQQIAQAILENQNDHEIQTTLFRQLIRRPSDKTLLPKVPEDIVIPAVKQEFEDLIPVMLKNNQAILAAGEQVESSQALLTNASLQALPDFQLMAALNEWQPAGAPNPGLTQDYSLSVGVAVPIFFVFNELPGIRAAKHDLAASENHHTSQQLQAISALQTAYTSLKAMLKDLDASVRLVVPAARASYDLTLLTYGLGKADYFMLNTSRNAWRDAERDMLTKRQNAAQLYNQLIAQMGCDIARTEGAHVCK